ncbi:MAG: nucleotidyltransferase family protein [Colwellia sp.]
MDQKYVLTESSNFKDMVESLDRLGFGFLAVTDEKGLLKGIVTDGDIRRAVLKGNFEVKDLINIKPEVMSCEATQREVVSRLKLLHRRHMPLVDDAGRLIDVFTLDNVEYNSKNNPVVIMAGGLGSRLGVLTKEIPKPMLCVGEKPMLQHLIEMFSDHGYNKFIICVNYKKEVIKDYFGSGRDLGVEIEYIEEDKRLGTAGALSLMSFVPECPFFVINGDILATVDFTDLLDCHNRGSSIATMCVRKYSHEIPYGVIKVDDENKISEIKEKPITHYNINAGIYVMNPSVLQSVPEKTYFDMPSLFEVLISKGYKTAIYPISDYWLDIGRLEDFEKANLDLKL